MSDGAHPHDPAPLQSEVGAEDSPLLVGPGIDALGGVDETRLHGTILRSSAWVGVSLAGKQLMSFVSLLVLARLVEPEAFGLAALAWTVLSFVEQIQESGVGSALIYRREDVDAAAGVAVLWAPGASIVLYAGTFLVAPIVAHLFHSPSLTSVLRVLALVLVFRGLAVVPAALLERRLDFRARAKADVASAVVQVATSVPLAFAGLGVWSLVLGALAGAATYTAVLWMLAHSFPRPAINIRVLRELIRYGRFVSLGSMLGVLDNTVDNLTVARLLGTTALGYYSVAFRLADFPTSVLSHVVSRVMFPVYSMLQDDAGALRRAYLQTLQRVAIVTLPVSVGIIVAAKPIVLALLGPKWLVAVTPLRILGVYSLIKPLVAPAGEVFKAIGKPHLNPLFSIPHLALAVPLLYVLTKAFGLNGAALAMVVLMAVVGIPASALSLRLVGISHASLARALAAPTLCAVILGFALAMLIGTTRSLSPVVSLLILVVGGVIVYAATAAVFAREMLAPMWTSLRETRS